jgi:hypothetical protein
MAKMRECQQCGEDYDPTESDSESPMCFCSGECEMEHEEGKAQEWFDNEFGDPEAEPPDWSEVMG